MTIDGIEVVDTSFPEDKGKYQKMKLTEIFYNLQSMLATLINDPTTCNVIDEVGRFYFNNPFLFIISIVAVTMMILPIIIFITVIVANIGIAFIGFIVIQVSVLIVGAVVLCCIFSFFVTVIIITGFFFVLAYYIIECIQSSLRHAKAKVS